MNVYGDWWLEKLRFKHRRSHCRMDAFLLRFNIMYLIDNVLILGKMPHLFFEWAPSSEVCDSLQNKLFNLSPLLHRGKEKSKS